MLRCTIYINENRAIDMDDTKTLEVLERQIWGDPEFNSHLVRTCHQLRKIPLKDLTPENLRMLIGQQIGLTYP